MPKVIKNLKEKILEVSREELFTNGYQSLSMRHIANKCEIATGTLYNYYSSKDMLVASIIYMDWDLTMQKIAQKVQNVDSLQEGLKSICDAIYAFSNLYKDIFQQSKIGNIRQIYPERHTLLVNQIGGHIKTLLHRCHMEYDEFEITFIASSILNSCDETWPYEQVESIYMKILKRRYV